MRSTSGAGRSTAIVAPDSGQHAVARRGGVELTAERPAVVLVEADGTVVRTNELALELFPLEAGLELRGLVSGGASRVEGLLSDVYATTGTNVALETTAALAIAPHRDAIFRCASPLARLAVVLAFETRERSTTPSPPPLHATSSLPCALLDRASLTFLDANEPACALWPGRCSDQRSLLDSLVPEDRLPLLLALLDANDRTFWSGPWSTRDGVRFDLAFVADQSGAVPALRVLAALHDADHDVHRRNERAFRAWREPRGGSASRP